MLVVHHWDTDGICSAALLKKKMEPDNFSNISPPIGEFSFDDRIRDAVQEEEDVYVVDLNLPHIVEKIDSKMTFIDHHHQPHIENDKVDQINPLVHGKSAIEYPSATTVISDELDMWNELSVLGAAGDVGKKAFSHPKVCKIMDGIEISEEEILRLVTLIDSNYVAMDQDGVENAVDLVLEKGLSDLLEYRDWNDKVRSIGRTMEDTLDSIVEINGFAYMNIKCGYNIISKLARIATWEKGYKGAIVMNSGFNGKAQTYFRVNDETSRELDIKGLIDDLKASGINAGGKNVVMGSIYPAERIDDVMIKVEKAAGLEGLKW